MVSSNNLCFARYSPLTRQTVSSRISGGLANVKADIADVLKEAASRICCTTDGWTSISMESYIVVTAHFLTHDWKMQGLVIAFDGMEESHTGENLAKRFVEVAEETGIKDKISSIVSDNAANAILGITLAAEQLSRAGNTVIPLRCLTHVINLVAKEGFEKLKGPMAKLKSMVTKLRLSNDLLSHLKKFCAANGEKYHKPQTDTLTRWNSTLAMLDSMLSMKKSLVNMSGSIGALSEVEWNDLKLIRDLLEPFKEATDLLSGSSYCTLSLGSLSAETLWNTLHTDTDKFKDVGIQAMITKLKKYRDEIDEQALLPSFFDPRTLHLMPSGERNRATNEVKKMLKPTTQAAMKPQGKLTFLDRIKKEGVIEDKALKNHPELQDYLLITGIDLDRDPLQWWAENEKYFPTIAPLARDYLAMIASTVPSEETFSAAGNTITERRNRLSVESAESIIITQSWLKFQRKLKSA